MEKRREEKTREVADGQQGYCHTILTHPPQERSEPLRQDGGTKLLNGGGFCEWAIREGSPLLPFRANIPYISGYRVGLWGFHTPGKRNRVPNTDYEFEKLLHVTLKK